MATREEVLHAFIHNRESLVVNRGEKMNATMDKMIANAERKIRLHNKAVKENVSQGMNLDVAKVMGYGSKTGREMGD